MHINFILKYPLILLNYILMSYLFIKLNITYLIFFKYLYLKKISLFTYKIIYKELYIYNYKCNIFSKNKHDLSYSSKKLWSQKHTGKSRVNTKKSPIWKGGIKLFKPKYILKKLKINKIQWKNSLILLLFIKKSFIIIFKNTFNLINILIITIFKLLFINKIYSYLIINFKNNNKFIYLNTIYKYKIIYISYLKLLDIIKYKYIIILL